jgi:FMN phosphatase YigB (HAD superfamily)
MPAAYADWIERDHDFFAWFDDGVFSARVRQMKPDPAIYATAVERFGVQGQMPWFIDDVQRNLDAASAHGWRGVRFETAAQVREQLVGQGVLPA